MEFVGTMEYGVIKACRELSGISVEMPLNRKS